MLHSQWFNSETYFSKVLTSLQSELGFPRFVDIKLSPFSDVLGRKNEGILKFNFFKSRQNCIFQLISLVLLRAIITCVLDKTAFAIFSSRSRFGQKYRSWIKSQDKSEVRCFRYKGSILCARLPTSAQLKIQNIPQYVFKPQLRR